MAKNVKSVTLESVATKVNRLYVYEFTKHQAAVDLGLSDYMFKQMSEQAYVIGKIDANANRITQCSLYYLKSKALKAIKNQKTECADACIAGLDIDGLKEALSFKNKAAVSRCIDIFHLNEDDGNIAKVIIWGLQTGDQMEKMFEKVRLIGIYLRERGED